MLVLLWLLILMMMMMMMKIDETVRALSGEGVLLSSQLRGGLGGGQDVRWTHPRLLLSLKNNVTACHHGRCSLQRDGSLRFSRVTPADAGNYSLEVFAADGTRLLHRHFLLTVGGSADNISSSVLVPVLICCFLFLLFFIIFFILRRRRSQSTRSTGRLEENVYVEMKSHHDNKTKDEEKSQYVPCHPVVSMETPITEPRSVDEDIYV
ncbi:uncharacterized protein LOC120544162 isoform X2 [Perca fluviatilis]|uniref:uncharacterized protein LOC120544162 isoform X2 n=1 Tax=Perca fluviatilis TaxID=8168 RepID=UPI00196230BB|nr:uncharacterized protein LOC120544162 isoform X2 [Perca fluviatilis]